MQSHAHAPESRRVLVSIWACILSFDASCRQELIKDKSHTYFLQYLIAKDTSTQQRAKSAFVLTEICNGYKEGQQVCAQQGLHRACTSLLAPKNCTSKDLKKWLCLCLAKLCEDNPWARYLTIAEGGQHTQLFPVLLHEDPGVRACAALALGEIFGASDIINPAGTSGNHSPSGTGPSMSPMPRCIWLNMTKYTVQFSAY